MFNLSLYKRVLWIKCNALKEGPSLQAALLNTRKTFFFSVKTNSLDFSVSVTFSMRRPVSVLLFTPDVKHRIWLRIVLLEWAGTFMKACIAVYVPKPVYTHNPCASPTAMGNKVPPPAKKNKQKNSELQGHTPSLTLWAIAGKNPHLNDFYLSMQCLHPCKEMNPFKHELRLLLMNFWNVKFRTKQKRNIYQKLSTWDTELILYHLNVKGSGNVF